MERFIKDYANYQKETIGTNELIQEDIKTEALNKIDNVLKARERGLITVNETMDVISNVFSR